MAVFLSARAAPSSPGLNPVSRPEGPQVEQEEKFSHWGPQNFLGWLPIKARRSELDNSISPFAYPPPSSVPVPGPVSPEASALGQSVLEEFVLFLTMKEAGLLDLCMQLK